ncbi:MAG: transketolase, partial [Bacillota bacterium]
MYTIQKIREIEKTAIEIRKLSMELALLAGNNGAHIAPAFSIAEIMATLYKGVMRHDPKNPLWAERDRFILSKGHAVLGLYTVLSLCGYFGWDLLKTFETTNSPLAGHPSKHVELGIECSAGSLGHGLSLAVGQAIGLKKRGIPANVYTLIGDGECNEGSNYEAALLARHMRLDNLVAIVDYNRLQSDGYSRDIIDTDLAAIWKALGWKVCEVNGHNVSELYDVLHSRHQTVDTPYVVIAHTVKGKGVSFMEHAIGWHAGCLSQDDMVKALTDMDGAWE